MRFHRVEKSMPRTLRYYVMKHKAARQISRVEGMSANGMDKFAMSDCTQYKKGSVSTDTWQPLDVPRMMPWQWWVMCIKRIAIAATVLMRVYVCAQLLAARAGADWRALNPFLKLRLVGGWARFLAFTLCCV